MFGRYLEFLISYYFGFFRGFKIVQNKIKERLWVSRWEILSKSDFSSGNVEQLIFDKILLTKRLKDAFQIALNNKQNQNLILTFAFMR
jgi:hypothetical protein